MAKLLTEKDVAAELGLTQYMVRAEKARGRLPFRKIGKFVRFTQADIDTYLERAAAEAAAGMRRTAEAQARKDTEMRRALQSSRTARGRKAATSS